MRRVLVGMLLVSSGWVAGVARPAPPVLRVRGLVLVDDGGAEVGRLVTTPRGAELVLGGASQASLVTDGEVAALNLFADVPVVRAVAAPGPNDDDPAPVSAGAARAP